MATTDILIDSINKLAFELFGFELCEWQPPVIAAQLNNEKGPSHVLCTAATGAGKTAVMLLPTFMRPNDITIMISPLTLLTVQISSIATKIGIKAVALTKETSTPTLLKEIGNGSYSLVCMSPEMLASPAFSDAFKSNKFFGRLRRVVIDEAHVVVSWGTTFRPAYTMLEHLRYKAPNLSLFLTSATLTPLDIEKLIENFRLPSESLTVFRRSNERPLMNYIVREVQHPMNTYKDLAFLLGSDRTYATPPPPFCIFTNSKLEAMRTIQALRSMLPEEHRSKLRWVSAATEETYREWLVKGVVNGIVWGFASTDIATMGLDVPNIVWVVEWRLVSRLSTLIQRFGRGGRTTGMEANAVFLVEAGAIHDSSPKDPSKRKALESAGPPTKRVAGNALSEKNQAPKGSSTDMVAVDYDAGGPIVTKKKFTVNKEPVEQAVLRFIRTQECRRVVFDRFYNTSIPPPPPHCARCDIPPFTGNCGRCDVCKPDLLLLLDINKQPKATRKVSIKTDLSLDSPLKARLVEWRETKYQDEYNGTMFLPESLLDDSQISKICVLAQNSKLRVAEDVRSHVDWNLAGEYGQEILKIVHELCPLLVVEASEDLKPTIPTPTTSTCSACHAVGHIKSNSRCPKFAETVAAREAARTQNSGKENSDKVPRKRRGKQAISPTPLATQPANVETSAMVPIPSTSVQIPTIETQLNTLSLSQEDFIVIDEA